MRRNYSKLEIIDEKIARKRGRIRIRMGMTWDRRKGRRNWEMKQEAEDRVFGWNLPQGEEDGEEDVADSARRRKMSVGKKEKSKGMIRLSSTRLFPVAVNKVTTALAVTNLRKQTKLTEEEMYLSFKC